jgi:hypothetical protein
MNLTFMLIFSFIFGTVIGSFLNVVIWRLPRDQKLTGRSHCPSCRHKLSGLDLVPVFSFLAFGGKCRYCHKKISWRYLFLEVTTGVLFVLAVTTIQNVVNATISAVCANNVTRIECRDAVRIFGKVIKSFYYSRKTAFSPVGKKDEKRHKATKKRAPRSPFLLAMECV